VTAPDDKEQTEKKSRSPRWRRLMIAAIIIIALIVLAILSLEHTILLTLQDHFTYWVAAAGPLGWLVLIFLLVMHSFVPFPLEFAAVAAGITYGFWLGVLLTWIGTVLGGILSFWISRRFGREFFERALNPAQLAWIEKHAKAEGTVALLVSRLLPFMSFTLVSYAAGLTPVSWFTFIWTSAIGMLPIIIVSVLYGAHIDNMPIEWAIGIPVVAVALVVGVYLFARKRGWIGESVH
jgi:uncharacterized membrane protein YdjX (TVP38/TMEM64 family)